MKLTVDRFEGDKVVCEDEQKKILTLPRNMFPCGVKEGTIVEYVDKKVQILEAETRMRRLKMEERFKRLLK